MPDLRLPNPDELKNLVAAHIIRTASRGTPPTVEHLAGSINEITLETETLGASILQVTLTDPAWTIANSGFLAMDSDGLLDEIDVNFPEGTGIWWRLAMVDFSDALTSGNLKLTFQDRIISYLQDKFGPKTVAPGTTTRAQFVKQLVDEVGKGDGLTPIRFVCHALNVVQPVASSSTQNGTTVVASSSLTARLSAKVNKKGAVGAGQGVTVKGSPPTASQTALINQVLGIASGLGAPRLAVEALLEACVQENSFTNNPGGGGTSNGLLQFTASTAQTLGIDPLNVDQCVTAFLTKSYYSGMSGYAGAIDYAKRNPTVSADQVAQAAQGSAYPAAYGQWLAEADAIIAAYGGGTPGLGGTTAGPAVSDVSQLARGTSANPDESSWECIQRLASDVNWQCFSNGDTLYFDDGPTLDAQAPTLVLSRDADALTWTATNPSDGRTASNVVTTFDGVCDNTAFLYQSTKKRKGKVQRQTRIRRPQTPTQIRFALQCGILDYRAGEVFRLGNAGPFTGKWVVEDTTRNCLADTHTQVTLGPPTEPNPEPAGTATTASTAAPSVSGGAPGSPSGFSGNYSSPFAKPMGQTTQVDMGVDFGNLSSGYNGGDPILALGDSYLRRIDPNWYIGQPCMFFELTDKSAGYWGWYVAEGIVPGVTAGPALIKGGVQVAAFTQGTGSIEIGWAANSTQTAAQANGHGASQTPEGQSFLAFLGRVGALKGVKASGGARSGPVGGGISSVASGIVPLPSPGVPALPTLFGT